VLANLDHPNIVKVHATGKKPAPFIAMEHVPGETLEKYCKALDEETPDGERRTWRAKLAAFVAAGRGLAAAHDQGVVHRDFKPQNVLVGKDSRVRVLDFGLARANKDPAELPATDPDASASLSGSMLGRRITRTGGRMGTPQYMAPEVHDAAPATEKSDQYSYCVALFEAIEGHAPFTGDTEAALREAKVSGAIEPPPRVAPKWLRRVIVRGLAADPERRFPSMHELLVALANDPRRRLLQALAVLAVLLVIAGGVWLLQLNDDLQRQASAERERAEEAQRETQDRIDRLTLFEVEDALPIDPTKALAILAHLSDQSPAWEADARIIAADAAHRGVARTEFRLSEPEIAHGLSPDGGTLVTRNPGTGEVRLLDLATKASQTLATTDAILPVVAFSPDGTRLAALRLRGGVGVWDIATLQHRPLGESPAEHNFVPFSPDGRQLVTYGRHPEVHVWDLESGARRVLPGHVEPVRSVRVSPLGDRIATVDDEGTVRLWAREGEPTIVEGTDPIAFGPDGSLLTAVGSDVLLHVPDRRGDPTRFTGRGAPITCIEISSDGSWLAAGDAEGGVRAWRRDAGTHADAESHADAVRALRFDADGQTLTAASLDRSLSVWRLPKGRPQKLEGHVGIAFWAIDPASREMVTVGHEGRVRRWDPPPVTDASWLAHEGDVSTIAAGRDGVVATGGSDGVVRQWNGETWQDVVTHGAAVTALAYAPDGRTLASADAAGELRVLAPDRTITLLGRLSAEVRDVAFTMDGGELVVADGDADVSLWSLASGQHRSLPAGDLEAARLRPCEGDELLAIAGWRPEGPPELRWVRPGDGEIARTVTLPEDAVPAAAAFTIDCRAAATATSNRTVLLWDVESGALRELPETHGGQVEGVAFAPDGLTLATASHDGTARLWDVRTGRRREIVLTIAKPRAIVFLRDGSGFTVGGDDAEVYLGRDDLPRGASDLRAWLSSATEVNVELAHLD
jgi:WD40 repeat protein